MYSLFEHPPSLSPLVKMIRSMYFICPLSNLYNITQQYNGEQYRKSPFVAPVFTGNRTLSAPRFGQHRLDFQLSANHFNVCHPSRTSYDVGVLRDGYKIGINQAKIFSHLSVFLHLKQGD